MAAVYVPRSPTTGVLYGVVRTHLTEFLAAVDAATDGGGLPGFVVNEFRKFLGCGLLSRGFARVRCGDCAFERLVPSSCKAGETGMVTSVQRVGGAVNVHLHFHTLVLDGVFVDEPDGTLRFHAGSPPTDDDVRRVVARVRRRLLAVEPLARIPGPEPGIVEIA